MGRDRNWLVVQEFAPADVRGNGSAIGSERLILEPVGGFIWGGELLTDVRVDDDSLVAAADEGRVPGVVGDRRTDCAAKAGPSRSGELPDDPGIQVFQA